MAKTNWEKLQDRDPSEDTRYRDVYEDQQLDRSKIEEKQSPVSRIIIAAVVSLLALVLSWTVYSAIEMGASYVSAGASQSSSAATDSSSNASKTLSYNEDNPYNYIKEVGGIVTDSSGNSVYKTRYQAVDENGDVYGPIYDSLSDVPEPDWYAASKQSYEEKAATPEGKAEIEAKQQEARVAKEKNTYWYWFFYITVIKFLVTFGIAAIVFALLYEVLMRNLAAQNAMRDTSDINQYQNDQHIALPEEVMRKFDYFPDAGAHSSVQVASMISHVALSNKGVKSVDVSKRADKDIVDADGDVVYLKGEILRDEEGNPLTEKKPMFDKKFMDELYEASGALTSIRKWYDPNKIDYNKGDKNRDKLKGYDTVADLINGDWDIPSYETQRPAGAYIVDTAPVNTLVLCQHCISGDRCVSIV